jgi:hypothetical protein
MQRKIGSKTRGEFIVEQIVWNAAAGAALAVMILVLLCSLQWLDQIAPAGSSGTASTQTPTQLARPSVAAADRPTEVIAANRPSG